MIRAYIESCSLRVYTICETVQRLAGQDDIFCSLVYENLVAEGKPTAWARPHFINFLETVVFSKNMCCLCPRESLLTQKIIDTTDFCEALKVTTTSRYSQNF